MKQIFNGKTIVVKGSAFVFGSLFYNCFVTVIFNYQDYLMMKTCVVRRIEM